MPMPAIETMAVVALTFLLAGFVKGVTELGLPTVSLAILTAALGLQPAMAILLAPSLVTNVWQALAGGHLREILGRIWSLLLALCAATWLGVGVLAGASTDLLAGLLGVLVCTYAVLGLVRLDPPTLGRSEPWLSPLAGAASGILNGMTGSFVVPGVLYLQALRLPRECFIQAMGVLFVTATVALGIALHNRRLLSADLGMLSAGAVVPALAGMVAGQRARQRLSEAMFRSVFFAVLLLVGTFITIQALSVMR